mgnify:CR=1 FL=1
MSRFSNKTAVTTGGARGLGLQMALAFARAGADIVLSDTTRKPWKLDASGSRPWNCWPGSLAWRPA